MANENLGPAERIIGSLLTYTDHAVHNRPGYVVAAPGTATGVQWAPVTHVEKDGIKTVFKLNKVGKKTVKVPLGTLSDLDNTIRNAAGAAVGTYRPAGLFPEVVAWMYRQVAEVWRLDNEFAAKWASFAYEQENRDLKVILAAFMLVQSRRGDAVLENGKVAFHDEDYRDIGEAMLLLKPKDDKFSPKLLLRIHEILTLPVVAEINRELGFGRSLRNPFLGRWTKAVEKWLQYREQNPKMLAGLVKAGYRRTVMELARLVGYKPTSTSFFQALRWRQKQAKDGHRSLAIGQTVAAAESWDGLDEAQVCQRIMTDRPGFKKIVAMVPSTVGITRAVMSAAIESGALSDKDLIIATPTLEDLGLLNVQDIKARWDLALKNADDMRAANIARNVRTKDVKEALEVAADTAVQKAVEEAVKNIRVYFIVDISGSMTDAIVQAKEYISKFAQAFPLERLHVAVFNTAGRLVEIKHASAAGITNAFKGIQAGGGTCHAAGIGALPRFNNADEDNIFIFVGDEGEYGDFAQAVRHSGLNPLAFGLIRLGAEGYRIITATAAALGIPCFLIDNRTFEDPYAIPRTVRALVAATPVNKTATTRAAVPRVTLVDQILKTELLKKPAWAA